MGRFIIGSKNHIDIGKLISTRSNLKSSGEVVNDSCFAISFHKRNVDNENFFKQGDNWIVGCGTFLYKGAIGEDALRAILEDLTPSAIRTLQREVIGHFILGVWKNESLIVFGDGLGTLELYYTHRNGEFLISNDFAAIAASMKDPKLDENSVYLEFSAIALGSSTPIIGINRLIGPSQFLRVESGSFRVESIQDDFWLIRREDLVESDDEAGVKYVIDDVKDVFSQLRIFQSIGLNFTGGLDGRLLLAALNDLSMRPELFYGVGNSYLTSTQGKDLEIVQAISRDYSLKTNLMNWSNDFSEVDEEHDRSNFLKFGLMGHLYGGGVKFHEALVNRNPDKCTLVFLGGFCPAFSNREFHERAFDSIEAIVDDILKGPLSSVAFRKQASVRRAAMNSLYEFFQVNGLVDCQGNFRVDGDVARAYAYIRSESEMLSLFNEYDYYIAPFNTYRLLGAVLKVPLSSRKNRKFQIRLVQSLDKDLMNYPLYSGLAERKVDLEKGELLVNHAPQNPPAKKNNRKFLFLRYLYYRLRARSAPNYGELDKLLYQQAQRNLRKSKINKDWYGWNLLNLRQSRRLSFLINIAGFLKSRRS
jgi:hypothetical protein